MKFELGKIIPLTKARDSLGKLVDRTRRGERFVISDRGELVSVLLPIREVERMDQKKKKTDAEKLIKRMDALAERISRNLPKDFDSLKTLHTARKERTKRLLGFME